MKLVKLLLHSTFSCLSLALLHYFDITLNIRGGARKYMIVWTYHIPFFCGRFPTRMTFCLSADSNCFHSLDRKETATWLKIREIKINKLNVKILVKQSRTYRSNPAFCIVCVNDWSELVPFNSLINRPSERQRCENNRLLTSNSTPPVRATLPTTKQIFIADASQRLRQRSQAVCCEWGGRRNLVLRAATSWGLNTQQAGEALRRLPLSVLLTNHGRYYTLHRGQHTTK